MSDQPSVEAPSIEKKGDGLALAGQLDLTTLMTFRKLLAEEFPFDREVPVDLAALSIEGSAVLALLIHMVRQARKDGGNVRFSGASDNLAAMASLAGVNELLGLPDTPASA